jgi:hypothetical protein
MEMEFDPEMLGLPYFKERWNRSESAWPDAEAEAISKMDW